MSDRRSRRPAAAVAALTLLAAGCTGADPEPAAEPSSPRTPLSAYDTTGVSVARAAYCDLVPDAAVEDALDGPPTRSSGYDNGDRTRLSDGTRDVAHEYGCTWAAGPAKARTWLFAPPVTGAQARGFVKEAAGAEGCSADRRAPAFGNPSLALSCTQDGTISASFRGLFGDAWLVCELTGKGDRTELLERAGRWCVQVVEAARTGSG